MNIFWDKITEHKLHVSIIKKKCFLHHLWKYGRQKDGASKNYRELTYWYEAMFSFILWNKYTVKSSSLEIKQKSILYLIIKHHNFHNGEFVLDRIRVLISFIIKFTLCKKATCLSFLIHVFHRNIYLSQLQNYVKFE